MDVVAGDGMQKKKKQKQYHVNMVAEPAYDPEIGAGDDARTEEELMSEEESFEEASADLGVRIGMVHARHQLVQQRLQNRIKILEAAEHDRKVKFAWVTNITDNIIGMHNDVVKRLTTLEQKHAEQAKLQKESEDRCEQHTVMHKQLEYWKKNMLSATSKCPLTAKLRNARHRKTTYVASNMPLSVTELIALKNLSTR